MTDFRELSDTFLASPQIAASELGEAKEMGVGCIVNNRPDGESSDQPPSADIERAAEQLGLTYRYIPITQAGFSLQQVDALAEAIDTADGKVLAFCRSGTRSTLLWALAQARRGEAPDRIAQAAAQAGYDVSPVRGTMEALAADQG